jgi:purine-cytosine permease-like protein
MSVFQIAGFCVVSVIVVGLALAILTITENIKLSRRIFKDGDEL